MAEFATIMGTFGFILSMAGLCISVYKGRQERFTDFLLLGFLCLIFTVLGVLSLVS